MSLPFLPQASTSVLVCSHAALSMAASKEECSSSIAASSVVACTAWSEDVRRKNMEEYKRDHWDSTQWTLIIYGVLLLIILITVYAMIACNDLWFLGFRSSPNCLRRSQGSIWMPQVQAMALIIEV